MSTDPYGESQQENTADKNFEPDPGKEIKVTLYLNKEVLNKIKTLARRNIVPVNDQINEALCGKINEFEEMNGALEFLQDEDYF